MHNQQLAVLSKLSLSSPRSYWGTCDGERDVALTSER